MSARRVVHYPSELVLVAEERELLAGVLHAAALLEDDPEHPGALRVLARVPDLERDLFTRFEARAVLDACQSVLAAHERVIVVGVRDELRRRLAGEQRRDALELLAHLVAFDGPTPVESFRLWEAHLRTAAEHRRAYRRALDADARVLNGEAT